MGYLRIDLDAKGMEQLLQYVRDKFDYDLPKGAKGVIIHATP